MTTPEPGDVFNLYPVLLKPGDTSRSTVSGWIRAGHGCAGQTGNGLPFQIVATQPGILPGDDGSYAPILP